MKNKFFYSILILSVLSACGQPSQNDTDSNANENNNLDSSSLLTMYTDSSNTNSDFKREKIQFPLRCEKCNGEYVKELKMDLKRGADIDTNTVILFLCTIDSNCRNNVEFSQFSNAVLFLLLEKEPNIALEILSEYEFQLGYILEMLSQPIHDGINLEAIRSKLLEINTNTELRDTIINSIP